GHRGPLARPRQGGPAQGHPQRLRRAPPGRAGRRRLDRHRPGQPPGRVGDGPDDPGQRRLLLRPLTGRRPGRGRRAGGVRHAPVTTLDEGEDMDLEGRSAIVTGGAGGLGSATVRRLAAAGMGVVVFDRDGDRSAELAEELGDRALAVAGDVNDDQHVGEAVDAACSLGPLSVLVNVAGGGVPAGRLVSRDGIPYDKASFVTTMEMNAIRTFNVSRLAAVAMGRNEPDDEGQRGVIVNTASIAGIEGQRGQVAYAAAKAAILGMT